MKNDTEEAIRVTITFRRESYIEWYDRLVDVKSGRARADIVRAHLSLPRAVNTSPRVPRQVQELTPPSTPAAPVAPFLPPALQQTPKSTKPGPNE